MSKLKTPEVAIKLVRVARGTHRRLKIEAARRGLSIGAYITFLARQH